jgi:ribokinase
MTPALVVVGSLNMDFVVRVDDFPAPGQTVLGHDFQMTPGGKGANQAYAAARLGVHGVAVRMIGRVGYDAFADHLKASLSAAGVDASSVHGTRAHSTGVALIWVDRQGQNSIVVAPGANLALAAGDVEGMRQVFRDAALALFQLETPLDTVSAAMAVARQEGLRTMLDPAPACALPPELLARVDILTPNESEALRLLGRPAARIAPADAPALAAALLLLGPGTVILKLGEHGCYYAGGDGGRHYPAPPVEVLDTTAAGDTFNAALAVALAEGRPFAQAIPFANAAAALSVTRPGAQASVPTRAELDAFLKVRV